MVEQQQEPGIILTPEEKKRQRQRNVAIAIALVALCVLFWAVTLVKGPAMLTRPM
ncbi:CoxF protein [Phreatobacter aquaticus]|uniref:CoxF protein n=1 Tax=Phreatobacter aquaticus TaxID=2570229 RepID=A0A4D7QGD8_9HYPH|nr:CoxF protein [Phreatobacter aquaticus]QCK86005.1 CoxF protein [Phreatobacter aquaticus]